MDTKKFNFHRKYFHNGKIITKITKILCYENLEPYGSWNTSSLLEVIIAEWLVHGSVNAKFMGLIPHYVSSFFA